MVDTFDKSSIVKIDRELLNSGAYLKNASQRIARRVGNEESDPLHTFTGDLVYGKHFDKVDKVRVDLVDTFTLTLKPATVVRTIQVTYVDACREEYTAEIL